MCGGAPSNSRTGYKQGDNKCDQLGSENYYFGGGGGKGSGFVWIAFHNVSGRWPKFQNN